MGEAGDGRPKCPSCGAAVGPNDRYCSVCGDALPGASGSFCRSCGAEFDRGDEYCSACGAPRARPTPEQAPGRHPHRHERQHSREQHTGQEHPDQHRHDQQHPGDKHASQEHPDQQRPEALDQEPDESEESRASFRRRVNEYLSRGWEVEEDYGDQVVVVDRDYGGFWIHLFLLLATGGVGNVLYAIYRYDSSASRRTLVRGQDDPIPADEPTQGTNVGLYVLGAFLLLWGIAWLFGGLTSGAFGIAIVGAVLAALGLFAMPAVSRRIAKRESVTEFGTKTSTTDKTVEDDPATCVVCGEHTDSGLDREYKKQKMFAGVPIYTVDSGSNRYCPTCGLTHAFGKPPEEDDATHRDPEQNPEPAEPARSAVDDLGPSVGPPDSVDTSVADSPTEGPFQTEDPDPIDELVAEIDDESSEEIQPADPADRVEPEVEETDSDASE